MEYRPDPDVVDDAVCEILLRHGPDGHLDGHEKITEFILNLLVEQNVYRALANVIPESEWTFAGKD